MKVILFGATGMVGQGVLRECLLDDGIESVLAVGRTSLGLSHPKLLELLRNDLFDFGGVAVELQGHDACFFCLGVSSAGMAEAEYTHLTYDLTIGWANELARINPAMTFIYVSGAGTGGKSMWAQVKGRTEQALLELFPKSYMFRIGAVRAMHREISKTRWTRILYSVSRPLWPLLQAIAPGTMITTEELGRAMIQVARAGAPKRVLENRDLRAVALGGTRL
jgi:uncharacterized protein YbjT (DUF2867 family)